MALRPLLQEGVVGREVELARDAQRFGRGDRALELDALLGLVDLGALQAVDEVEVPPGAAELAVGGELQPHLLLLPGDPPDLLVLHRLQLRRRRVHRIHHPVVLMKRGDVPRNVD